jgi:putative membrane protein
VSFFVRFFWLVIANGVALAATAWILDDVRIDDFATLVLAAFVFAIVNFFVKPVVKILGIPLIILTLGLFLFVINMLMLWLVDVIVDDFQIDGFWTYVWAAIIVWLVNWALELVPPFSRD